MQRQQDRNLLDTLTEQEGTQNMEESHRKLSKRGEQESVHTWPCGYTKKFQNQVIK